jgi:SNF2 family DNA or RNA helicase
MTDPLFITLGSKTLLRHQSVAVAWMIAKEREDKKRVGGLLCDEMGLGKTLTVLGTCVNNPVSATLLFCPLAVVQQWVDAAKDVGLGVMTLEKGIWEVKSSYKKHMLFITNSDKILSRPSNFDRFWDRIVIDEAHQIRNPESRKYKAIDSLERKSTWCLSATPVVNKVNDASALLHLVTPSVSTELSRKSRILELMEEHSMARSVNSLREILPIFPKPANTTTHFLDFVNEEETRFYRGVQGKLTEELQNALFEADKSMTAIFEILLRLRQLSVHPQIYIEGQRKKYKSLYPRPDWTAESTKIRMLLKLIGLCTEGHSWVVFCQFHDEIELLRGILEGRDEIGQVETYHGGMSLEQREAVVEKTKAFQEEGKHQILLLQIHCGGTGLNLQHMDRIIFMSPWWTAALMDQAVGRVMRIGQKKDVEVHHLRLKESESMNIDKLIFEKVEQKRDLCEELLAAARHEY